MKRLLFLVTMLVMIVPSSIAQKKYASNGYLRAGLTAFFPWESHGDMLFFPALNITPGYRVVQGSDFALVVTLPVSAGVVIESMDESYFGFDVPAMLEMHFVSATGNTLERRMGFMLGAGAGYHFTGDYHYPYHYDYEDPNHYEYRQLDFWGYRLMAGVSFGKEASGVGAGDRGMILGQFGHSFGSQKESTVGIGLYLILGNRKKLSERSDL